MPTIIMSLISLTLWARYIEKGPQAVAMVLLVLACGWLWWRKPIKNSNSIHVYVSLLFVAVLISWLISSLVGINPHYGFKSWLQVALTCTGGIIVFQTLRRFDPQQMSRLPTYISLWFVPLGLLFLGEYFTNKQLFHTGSDLKISYFSSLIAIGMPYLWSYALDYKNRWRWLIPALAVFCAGLTDGRTGMVALLGLWFIFPLVRSWSGLPIKGRQWVLYAAHFMVIGTLSIWVSLSTAPITQTFYGHFAPTAHEGLDAFSSGRLDIWWFALTHVHAHPWFGIGLSNFRHMDFTGARLSSTMHPHNALVEILLETGIVGLALTASLAAAVIWQLLGFMKRHRKQTPRTNTQVVNAFCAISAFIVCSMFLTSFFAVWWLGLLVIQTSIALANTHPPHKLSN